MLAAIGGLLKNRFQPFQHRSFSAFFFAQSFSIVGTWSHELARSFLALEIGGTTAALGSLSLSVAIPALVCSLHGGVVADQRNPRQVMILTKSLLGISALGFFFLAEFGSIELWMIYVFGFCEGLLNAYDGPAFTSTFQRLVPKKDFKMAIMLNSANFHLSRMFGPVIAGVLMWAHGPSLVFLFDTLTYFTIALVLKNLTLRNIEKKAVASSSWFARIFEGVRYINSKASLRYKQLQLLLTVGLLIPVAMVVFRSYLKTRFDLDGDEFGFLFSLPALGALAGATTFVLLAFDEPIKNLRFSIPSIVIILTTIPFAPNVFWSGVWLATGGYFSYISIASITQSMHFEIDDEYRGRLGSLIMMSFNAIAPLMSFPLSLYTDHYGFHRGIRDPVMLFALGSVILFLMHRNQVRTLADLKKSS